MSDRVKQAGSMARWLPQKAWSDINHYLSGRLVLWEQSDTNLLIKSNLLGRWASPTSTSASHTERSWKYKHYFCHIGPPDWGSLPGLSKAEEEVPTGVCSLIVKGLCEDASKYFPMMEVSLKPKSRGMLVSSHPHFVSISLARGIFAKNHLCFRPLGFMRDQSQI